MKVPSRREKRGQGRRESSRPGSENHALAGQAEGREKTQAPGQNSARSQEKGRGREMLGFSITPARQPLLLG